MYDDKYILYFDMQRCSNTLWNKSYSYEETTACIGSFEIVKHVNNLRHYESFKLFIH